MPAIRWREEGGYAHEEAAIASALEIGAGGFIIFGGTGPAVTALTRSLRQQAGRPLLIASDLERGAGQQFDGLTQLPPPRALASLDRLDVSRWAGEVTAREALAAGINWVFAPVADLDNLPSNPIVQTRAFAADPLLAAEHVAAWIEGCEGRGALACAKHYPGHGRTTVDSHIALPAVNATREELEADGHPFKAAIGAGVASLMTAHVAYPALDPSGLPATMSAPILAELRRAGFTGLIVTDALIMEGAHAGRTEAEAGVDALAAGADILLYPTDPRAMVGAIDAALVSGRLPAARVDAALARYEVALTRAGQPTSAAGPAPFASAAVLADALLSHSAPASLPVLRRPLELVVIDDDLGGPYPPTPADTVERTLRALGVPLGPGGSRVVLAFAEPRAWKGRAGFGERSLATLSDVRGSALTILFGHPRLSEQLTAGGATLVAWHRQRLMQEAAARWLASKSS